jgi:hypothetical protein
VEKKVGKKSEKKIVTIMKKCVWLWVELKKKWKKKIVTIVEKGSGYGLN